MIQRRTFFSSSWSLLSAIVCIPIAGCITPTVFDQASAPRAGRPLNNRLCLVFSDRSLTRILGFERLHPFDINKYSRIYLRLVLDGVLAPEDVFVPTEISRQDLLRVHTQRYLEQLEHDPAAVARALEAEAARRLPSFVTRKVILQPFRVATGGTLLASRLALDHGMAINLAGGYHHAEPDRGGGFCLYADIAIAVRTLQAEGRVQRVLSIDLDVHQGNGTALCLAADPNIFTFDMHSASIYPIPKAKNDLDVPLRAGIGDADYLKTLRQHLSQVFDEARPDLVVYQAGVDGYVEDPLGNLALSRACLIERDRLVFEEAARRRIPIVMTLGGGYSRAAWRIQYQSIRALIDTYGRPAGAPPPSPRPAGWFESNHVNGLPD